MAGRPACAEGGRADGIGEQASVAGAREVWKGCWKGWVRVGMDPQHHTGDPGQSHVGAEG